MKRLTLCFILLALARASVASVKKQQEWRSWKLVREARSVTETPNNDCRYEKGPWLECDVNTGLQKRILKIKGNVNQAECPLEKFIERQCKKQCKYIKGVWSECANGEKERTDKLKADVSTAGCKPEKRITKQCKKQCNYAKPQWTNCENGFRTKILILMDDPKNNADCEPERRITKSCHKSQRFRAKSRD